MDIPVSHGKKSAHLHILHGKKKKEKKKKPHPVFMPPINCDQFYASLITSTVITRFRIVGCGAIRAGGSAAVPLFWACATLQGDSEKCQHCTHFVLRGHILIPVFSVKNLHRQ